MGGFLFHLLISYGLYGLDFLVFQGNWKLLISLWRRFKRKTFLRVSEKEENLNVSASEIIGHFQLPCRLRDKRRSKPAKNENFAESFLADISHEVENPNFCYSGYIHTLLTGQ